MQTPQPDQDAAARERDSRRRLPAAGASSLPRLPAARAEMEQLETSLLSTARAPGRSWGRISSAMGPGSAQAAPHRFGRPAERVESRGTG